MLEGGPVEPAGDLEPGAALNGAQIVQANFEVAHIGNAKRAQIENSSSAFRNDVGARAAFDDAGVDGEAAAKIIPFLDAPELPRQFVNGVESLLRREARMRCAAMHDSLVFTDSLPFRLQQSARTEGSLQDKDGIAAPRFRFQDFAGGFAADLLVGRPQDNDAGVDRY